MSAAILVVNAGSSSVKFAVYPAEAQDGERAIYHGEVEGVGHVLHLLAKDRHAAPVADTRLDGPATHEHALGHLLEWHSGHSQGLDLVAAGHRVVHGGRLYAAPARITPQVVRDLETLIPLAPLHQPHNLAAIAALARLHPTLPQVACFDTAFHVTQPEVAAAFALPHILTDKGVRRYGFHGLSYEYIASILPDHLGAGADGKVIVAHLGQGASLCAMRGRRSVATTMGFTALDGLVMGRRCGALDPGVILYLMESEGMDAARISELLYQESGLLGVSGISDDMRDLLAASEPRAKAAIDLFVYRISRELGSLAAALGGLDALVFTAGIGEHSPDIRALVCRQAAWLGAAIDESANAAGSPRISAAASAVSVWALTTDEERMVARHTRSAISNQ